MPGNDDQYSEEAINSEPSQSENPTTSQNINVVKDKRNEQSVKRKEFLHGTVEEIKRAKNMKTALISKNVDSISLERNEELNLIFAQFLIQNDISFNVVQSKYLKAFINGLKPAFQLFDANTFSTNLFQKCYEQALNSVHKKSETECVLMLAKKSNQKIKVLTKALEGPAVVFDELDLDMHNRNSLIQSLEKLQEEIKLHFNQNVVAVIENCFDNPLESYGADFPFKIFITKCHTKYISEITKRAFDEDLKNEVDFILKYFGIQYYPNTV